MGLKFTDDAFKLVQLHFIDQITFVQQQDITRLNLVNQQIHHVTGIFLSCCLTPIQKTLS
ncbi:hypothetical protein D3C76_1573330 [compost metagenome]